MSSRFILCFYAINILDIKNNEEPETMNELRFLLRTKNHKRQTINEQKGEK